MIICPKCGEENWSNNCCCCKCGYAFSENNSQEPIPFPYSISEQQYLSGIMIMIEENLTTAISVSERLNVDFKSAVEIVIGAEEMGVITRESKRSDPKIAVSLERFFKNIHFYKSGIKARMHDFNSIEGIQSIPIPQYKRLSGIASPVNNVEYVLQRRATRHKRNGNMDLAIECLRKSNEIMPHSNFRWNAEDYLRLISYLRQANRNEEADAEEQRLKEHTPDALKSVGKRLAENNQSRWEQGAKWRYDLITYTSHAPTCAECSKYQGRVFALTEEASNGKYKGPNGEPLYFRMLPVQIRETGKIHEGCRHSSCIFVTAAYTPAQLAEISRKSMMPLVDVRSEAEIKAYEAEQKYNREIKQDREMYASIKKILGNEAPKSFAGFRRMKAANSKNYRNLIESLERHQEKA